MNFKEWLVTELNVDMSRYDFMKEFDAENIIRNFSQKFAFIYSADTDEVYIDRVVYHHQLLRLLGGKDLNAATKVYSDKGAGVIGRIGQDYYGDDEYSDEPLKVTNMEHVVAFYTKMPGFKFEYTKKAVSKLMEKKWITPLSFVLMPDHVYFANEFVGVSVAQSQPVNKDKGKNLKQIETLKMAYKTGRWPDGRDLTKPERDYVKDQIDSVDSKITKKNPWQSALEKNKLIVPGTNFRTPYSDATNYEV